MRYSKVLNEWVDFDFVPNGISKSMDNTGSNDDIFIPEVVLLDFHF